MYRLGLHFGVLLRFNLWRIGLMAFAVAVLAWVAWLGTAHALAEPVPALPKQTILTALNANPAPYAGALIVAFKHIGWIEHRFPPVDRFWEKFLPMAQLGCAISIAYLALPYFRHLKTLGERAASIVGRTPDELAAFRRLYLGDPTTGQGQPYVAATARDELMALLTLSDALAATPITSASLTVAMEKLRTNQCIRTERPRKVFLEDYLVGGDIAVVLGGLLVGLTVHVLAFAECVFVWQVQDPLALPFTQSALMMLLMGWSCGAPIYYAYHGARVSISLDGWLHQAELQRREFDTTTRDGTKVELDRVRPTAEGPGRPAKSTNRGGRPS